MTETVEAPPRTELPTFHGVHAWRGEEMARRTDWTHALDAADVAEIDAAIRSAQSRGVGLVDLQLADFPLPRLAPRLRAIRNDILHGHGFALLRGWPSRERSLEESAYAFRGIGAHLGDAALCQNGKGHVLGHVANLGMNYADPATRGYQTSAELRFHVDAGDIVGLLCVRPGRTGGKSKIASSTTVWNEIVRRRPDLAAELLKPFSYSRWGELIEGRKPTYEMPVYQQHAGRIMAVYVYTAIEKSQAFEGAIPLTAQRREALDMLHAISDEDGIRLDMDFRPGDMQFLCNHSTFHSRTAYEDWPDPAERRHLLRLWLACDDGPPLPESYTTQFQGSTPSGRPNGFRVPGVKLIAPLEPA